MRRVKENRFRRRATFAHKRDDDRRTCLCVVVASTCTAHRIVRGVAPQESLTSQRRNRVSPCDRVSYLPVPPGYFRPVGTRGRGTHLCTCCGRALELLGTANLPRRSAAVEANSVTAEPVFPRASGRVGRFRRRATFRRSAVLVTCCDLCLDAASTGWRGNPPAA
jgi:hypothetical protein